MPEPNRILRVASTDGLVEYSSVNLLLTTSDGAPDLFAGPEPGSPSGIDNTLLEVLPRRLHDVTLSFIVLVYAKVWREAS